MKTRPRTPISAKIEMNKDKIYRISDPVQLSEIFFPSKNARQRRAAFLAIIFEIKNARDQKLSTTDHIANKYSLSQSSIVKARTKMTRIGLIRKRDGYWMFSTVFSKSLEILVQKVTTYKVQKQNSEASAREKLFVAMAKGAKN
ncbi:hypothetical protein TRIP_B350110 [uncultured Desulfatiglans sp.]|uniref:Uncharacterized protein n=1 Tax=Uncultured Desulfatiglans sp. TaxID=1748965 RepID=A0A653AA40_UNCDX|nr:hypothetical protein TRIP_B350110 [uncultured Desulfatiglans sp.]